MAVLKYVTTTQRDEPTSFTNSKNTRNAAAVQTTDSIADATPGLARDVRAASGRAPTATQQIATNTVAPATTTDAGHVRQLGGEDHRPERVANADDAS